MTKLEKLVEDSLSQARRDAWEAACRKFEDLIGSGNSAPLTRGQVQQIRDENPDA